jgi:nucleoid DNA-binding protein
MQKNIAKILAKLADRNLSDEEIAELLARLAGKELQVEMQFQRNNATFAMNAPEVYRGGQTLNGKVDQQEVQVLVPKEDEKAARGLSYGTSITLNVRYLEFDDFYRRVTFTGSLNPASGKPEPVTEEDSSSDQGAAQPHEESKEASSSSVEPRMTPEPPAASSAKPKTGELAVFLHPKLTGSTGGTRAIDAAVSSAEIIADLSLQTQSSKEEAALVVDGFWDYLSDVQGHYKQHAHVHTLVIPHFGSFRFKHDRRGNRIMSFLTNPDEQADRSVPGSGWVDKWSGKPNGLSVRRRISVFVAERSGLPLPKADGMLNQLLQIVKTLNKRKVTIHWARRGTMRGGLDRSHARHGRNPRTGASMTINPREIYSFFASKGFLERLQASEPEIERRSSAPSRKEHPPRRRKTREPEQRLRERSLGDEKCSVPPMPLLQILILCASFPASVALLLGWRMTGNRIYLLCAIISSALLVGLFFKRSFYHRRK